VDGVVRSPLGGPGAVIFGELNDWAKRAEPGIRYYSGTVVYEKEFDCPPCDGRRSSTLAP